MGFLDSLLTGAGALLGGFSSSKGTDTGTKTTTNEPWAEAAPWLKQNIATGQQLQNYYQQNPFNQVQQTAYQNLLGDQDSFRSGALPGLMDFSNQLMSSNYQRAPSAFNPTGLGAATPSSGAPTPLQAAQSTPTTQNVFRAPAGQGYGTIDFNALNPYKNELAPKTQSATEGQLTPQQSLLYSLLGGGYGDSLGASGTPNASGSLADALGISDAKLGGLLGGILGGPMGGLLGTGLTGLASGFGAANGGLGLGLGMGAANIGNAIGAFGAGSNGWGGTDALSAALGLNDAFGTADGGYGNGPGENGGGNGPGGGFGGGIGGGYGGDPAGGSADGSW